MAKASSLSSPVPARFLLYSPPRARLLRPLALEITRARARADSGCAKGRRNAMASRSAASRADFDDDFTILWCYATKSFTSAPMPSISISTTSPGRRNRLGLKPAPTPLGVPVNIASPARKV